MKKVILISSLLLLIILPVSSQQSNVFLNADSLIRLLPQIEEDSSWLETCFQISRTLNNQNPAKAKKYNLPAYKKAKAKGDKRFMASLSNEVGVTYYKQGFPDSALYYFEKGVSLYKELKKIQSAKLLEGNIGMILIEKGNYQDAIDHYNLLLEEVDETKDSITYINYIGNIGLGYDYLGKYDKAFEYYYLSLELSKKYKSDKSIEMILQNIGALHLFLEQDDEAKNYFLQAVEMNRKTGNQNGLGFNYQNIALIFDYASQNDSSYYYHDLALKQFRLTENRSGIADELLNLGALKETEGNYARAEAFYSESLAIKEKIDNPERIASSYSVLGALYAKMKYYDKAEKYLNMAQKIYDDLGVLERQKENLGFFYDLNLAKKDYKSALLYFQQMENIEDSLFNEAKNEKIAFLQEEFKTKEKIAENDKLKKEKEVNAAILKKNRVVIFYGGFSLLLIVIILLILYAYSRRQRKMNHLLKDRHEQIHLLNREINHRVKNNLAFMTGILEMQARRLENLDAKEALKESEARLRALSLVHSTLFKSEQKSRLGLKEYIEDILTNLDNIFSIRGKQIHFVSKIEDIQLLAEDSMKIGLIINELVTNSIKHAFNEVDNPEISIHIHKNKDEGLMLEYTDNGPGIKELVLIEKKDSLGIKLIRLLTEQLNGQLNFDKKFVFILKPSI